MMNEISKLNELRDKGVSRREVLSADSLRDNVPETTNPMLERNSTSPPGSIERITPKVDHRTNSLSGILNERIKSVGDDLAKEDLMDSDDTVFVKFEVPNNVTAGQALHVRIPDTNCKVLVTIPPDLLHGQLVTCAVDIPSEVYEFSKTSDKAIILNPKELMYKREVIQQPKQQELVREAVQALPPQNNRPRPRSKNPMEGHNFVIVKKQNLSRDCCSLFDFTCFFGPMQYVVTATERPSELEMPIANNQYSDLYMYEHPHWGYGISTLICPSLRPFRMDVFNYVVTKDSPKTGKLEKRRIASFQRPLRLPFLCCNFCFMQEININSVDPETEKIKRIGYSYEVPYSCNGLLIGPEEEQSRRAIHMYRYRRYASPLCASSFIIGKLFNEAVCSQLDNKWHGGNSFLRTRQKDLPHAYCFREGMREEGYMSRVDIKQNPADPLDRDTKLIHLGTLILLQTLREESNTCVSCCCKTDYNQADPPPPVKKGEWGGRRNDYPYPYLMSTAPAGLNLCPDICLPAWFDTYLPCTRSAWDCFVISCCHPCCFETMDCIYGKIYRYAFKEASIFDKVCCANVDCCDGTMCMTEEAIDRREEAKRNGTYDENKAPRQNHSDDCCLGCTSCC